MRDSEANETLASPWDGKTPEEIAAEGAARARNAITDAMAAGKSPEQIRTDAEDEMARLAGDARETGKPADLSYATGYTWEAADLIGELKAWDERGPVLPPKREDIEVGTEPLDGLPLSRPCMDLDAHAARVREILRADSDPRPMAAVHAEAIAEDDRRHDEVLFDEWFSQFKQAAWIIPQRCEPMIWRGGPDREAG